MATEFPQSDLSRPLPAEDRPGGLVRTGGSAITPRQLPELSREDLDETAADFGLNPQSFQSRQYLIAAIHERRQVIGRMDRDAMLDVIRWGGRVVPMNATSEQIAQEIVKITSMRFAGLSHRGLMVLGQLRGLEVSSNEPVPNLIHRLKRQEGFFRRFKRKRRALLGSLVSHMIGDNATAAPSAPALPGPADATSGPPVRTTPPRSQGVKEEIEEAGIIRGITGRIKKTADSYLNQKLDEIEARIDRKLDEIDRRLVEWRDKEIANRIRILKITLWASVIVAAISLLYSYIKVYFYPHM